MCFKMDGWITSCVSVSSSTILLKRIFRYETTKSDNRFWYSITYLTKFSKQSYDIDLTKFRC